jgi:hypothetical protein
MNKDFKPQLVIGVKSAIVLSLIVTLFGCSPTKLVTNAPSTYTTETKKSFEEVWTNVIDYVTGKGTAIKTFDKASGIIVTDEYSFRNSYTFEDKSGNLKDPGAYVVLNTIKGGFGNTIKPEYVTGNYNIRVKQLQNGTSITVNLVNLKGAVLAGKNMYGGGGHWVYYKIKSTNVFEKELAEKLQ